jgi:nitrogen fixation-related uncharacterized protein
LEVDMLIYLTGAFAIAGITTGFFLWGLLTKQFREDAHIKQMPLEEDEKE